MGLTSQSTGTIIINDNFTIRKNNTEDIVTALSGNPNVGKSTVFNSLTGLKQHTGNWPGKTVTNAQGRYRHKGREYTIIDLPGTYSLMSNSVEEEIASDFICFGNSDSVIVVVDATALERNLNLVIQTLEITPNTVVCVNLMDEAERKNISINLKKLEKYLGVPVIGTNARKAKGLTELKNAVMNVSIGITKTTPFKVTYEKIIEDTISIIIPYLRETVKKLDSRWLAIRLLENDQRTLKSINQSLGYDLLEIETLHGLIHRARETLKTSSIDQDSFHDSIVTSILLDAENIYNDCVTVNNKKYNDLDRKLDAILTSKKYGFPIMLLLLGLIFWITIVGANYPSQLISSGLFWVEGWLVKAFTSLNIPVWITGILIKGMYRTLAWVVSVMLPPMAIFFPLFTLLEDLGYLPRVAFNFDNYFKKACAHGKQALTMCMGFGCNAAGVIGCRIIESPRERLIATITNNFVPCNGRFPTLITMSTIFLGGMVGIFSSLTSALSVIATVLLGVLVTLGVSKLLSITILRGMPSSFSLELPPFRPPQIGQVIIRSLFDRTMFVLGRAVSVAAPAGIIIWVMANVFIGDSNLLTHVASFLDPFAKLMGLDGYILNAFILGIPANEIVVPIIIMSYMSGNTMIELTNLAALKELFTAHGWTWLTAVCVILFSLLHFPCATTLWTIKKETQSWKWTVVSFLLPTLIGIIVCIIVAQSVRLIMYLI